MLPFALELQPNRPIADQIILATKRAVVSGQLRPGDRFPSVRVLSQELRINPTTAHRVITTLVDQGVLETVPTVGTLVARSARTHTDDGTELLGDELEKLVIEAKRRGITLEQLRRAVEKHWKNLQSATGGKESA